MKKVTKRIILIFFFGVLSLPYLNHRFEFITTLPLWGYGVKDDTLRATPKTWFDGTYQDYVNRYYNDHIGFRADLIRLNCQMQYTLFQKASYGGTTIGKDDYIYYDNYIEALYGRDYVGYEKLHERMLKLKLVADTLTKLGKTCVVVHAPNKAWYCAEYIPETRKKPKGIATNYDVMTRMLDSMGVEQVDFNKWFLALKDTSKGILFSRQGTHWTNYAAELAGDSLTRYIEHKRHIHMAHPYWTKVVHSTIPWPPDNDMEPILNLIFKTKVDTFTYPELQYPPDSGAAKPSCVYVGDSYTINLLVTHMIQQSMGDWQFWFYNRKYINDSLFTLGWNFPDMDGVDRISAIRKADCLVFLYCSINIQTFGDGLVEELYDYYYPKK